MIDLTPLDVRKKRGDFGRGVRGYNPQEVDGFLELVAERLEELVKENITLRERAERLAEQVSAQTGREQAVQQALVTAQQLREEIQMNAQKEAELVVQEARARGREVLAAAERQAVERTEGLHEIERRRLRFLASYRQFLEKELDHIAVEQEKAPLEEVAPVDMDLGEERSFRYDLPPLPGAEALAEGADVFPSLVERPREAAPERGRDVSGWDDERRAGDEPAGEGAPGTGDRPEASGGDRAPVDPRREDESTPRGSSTDDENSGWMPGLPRQGPPGDG